MVTSQPIWGMDASGAFLDKKIGHPSHRLRDPVNYSFLLTDLLIAPLLKKLVLLGKCMIYLYC